MSYQELDLIVLKHIITNKKNALEFIHDSSEKLFQPDVWRFAKLITDYIKVYKEIPTRKVISERIQSQKSETLNKYVNQLWDDITNVSCNSNEYKHDLEKLKNRFTEKLIYDLKDSLIGNDGRVDITKSVSELNSALNSIKSLNQVKAYDQKSLKESINTIRERYVAKQNDPTIGMGLKTGINFFDQLTNGLKNSEFLIIAGQTAAGKSILLSQIAQNLWMGDNNIDTEGNFSKGCDVVYFTLEMPLEHCLERLCANLAKVPQAAINGATLNDEQKQRMGKALKFIERYPHELIIVDAPRNLTPSSMELIYNDIVANRGKKPEIVVIDYLALMNTDDDITEDWLKQGAISEKIAEFGRINNINVITAVQMTDDDKNKSGANSIGTHRLSRSRMIGHNANFILMIEKRPNEAQRPDFILHMVKSRRSALGTGVLYKNLECCSLLNEPPPTEGLDVMTSDISDIVE